MAEGKIVKNASSGYGYKYSSLADLHKAGISIPKMRVKATEFGEFVEYLDEKGEWQTGARVVPFEAKGMNASQAYGAALTYARRYTVQMAESVACDDDDAVEKASPKAQNNMASASEKQVNYLRTLLREAGKTPTEIAQICAQAKKATSSQVSAWIEKLKEEKEN